MRPRHLGRMSARRARNPERQEGCQGRRRAGRGGARGFGVRPQSAPPNIPVNFQGASYLTQVVDQTYDVGRSPSVTLDTDGNPSATYLLLAPQLKKGAIPPPLLANTPQPPSVVIASQTDGIWTRRNVTPNASGGGKGTATEIADKDGLYDGQATVAMAVDPNGFHHVVWSTPSGLFYAKDDKVQLRETTTTLAFNGAPTQIVKTRRVGRLDRRLGRRHAVGGVHRRRQGRGGQPERLDVDRAGRRPGGRDAQPREPHGDHGRLRKPDRRLPGRGRRDGRDAERRPRPPARSPRAAPEHGARRPCRARAGRWGSR